MLMWESFSIVTRLYVIIYFSLYVLLIHRKYVLGTVYMYQDMFCTVLIFCCEARGQIIHRFTALLKLHASYKSKTKSL